MLIFFFFNDTATTEIYTLSLHDALPIFEGVASVVNKIEVLPLSPMDDQLRRAVFRAIYGENGLSRNAVQAVPSIHIDRKSTRLNSSHDQISYAVFCLKKKKTLRV